MTIRLNPAINLDHKREIFKFVPNKAGLIVDTAVTIGKQPMLINEGDANLLKFDMTIVNSDKKALLDSLDINYITTSKTCCGGKVSKILKTQTYIIE